MCCGVYSKELNFATLEQRNECFLTDEIKNVIQLFDGLNVGLQ